VENAALESKEIAGSLIVRGVASSVPLTIQRIECTDGVLHIQAGTALDRTQYPMFPPIAGVSRVINIELSITARASEGISRGQARLSQRRSDVRLG
jgi:hypothetical protein